MFGRKCVELVFLRSAGGFGSIAPNQPAVATSARSPQRLYIRNFEALADERHLYNRYSPKRGTLLGIVPPGVLLPGRKCIAQFTVGHRELETAGNSPSTHLWRR
jgi:hypothetical protein